MTRAHYLIVSYQILLRNESHNLGSLSSCIYQILLRNENHDPGNSLLVHKYLTMSS